MDGDNSVPISWLHKLGLGLESLLIMAELLKFVLHLNVDVSARAWDVSCTRDPNLLILAYQVALLLREFAKTAKALCHPLVSFTFL